MSVFTSAAILLVILATVAQALPCSSYTLPPNSFSCSAEGGCSFSIGISADVNYFYYNASAGINITATLNSSTIDLSLVASLASFAQEPNLTNSQYISAKEGVGVAESLYIAPDSDDCYVFAVIIPEGSSGEYVLQLLVDVPVITPDPSAPICRQLVPDELGLRFVDEAPFSEDYIVSTSWPDFFLISADDSSKITIQLGDAETASNATTADVDLYVTRFDDLEEIGDVLDPTKYKFSSATLGSAKESVSISTGNEEVCILVMVFGKNEGSYNIQVQSAAIEPAKSSSIALMVDYPLALLCLLAAFIMLT